MYGYVETISHTTRPPRKGELTQHTAKEGEKPAYFFTSEEDFENMIDEFIENVTFGGNRYGVHESQVVDHNKVVLVVEPDGESQIKEWAKKVNDNLINSISKFLSTRTGKLGKEIKVKSFSLEIPIETQIERMRSRGDSEEDIEKRMKFDDIRERSVNTDFAAKFNTTIFSAAQIAKLIAMSTEGE
jgi:hypothetical protein